VREEITATKPEKNLTRPLKKHGGRNNQGMITTRHIGGGHKRMYRVIDFRRNKDGQAATIRTIEYDPNRNVNISLVQYEDGEKRYILSPLGVKVDQKVYNGEAAEPRLGNCLPLAKIPVGLEVHNIEMVPGQGGKMVRTAGGVARLVARDGTLAQVMLPSGEVRMVHVNCRATIGQLGNIDWINIRWGKAGRTRHRGTRPSVRGVAQNPVSHPLGGGEGRSGGGRHPVSKWGVLAKGGKTRNPRKNSSSKIIRRRMTVRYGESVLKRR